MKTIAFAVPLALGALLSGCAVNERPAAIAQADDYAPRDYVVSAGDDLVVTVFGEDALSREVEVAQDGHIDLALIGAQDAAGKTIGELRAALAAAYGAGYIVNPRVTVDVKNYRPFTILGEVNKAGNYPYIPGLTLKGAVAAASGYTYRANRKEAFVRRRGEDRSKAYGMDRDPQVMPGDVVEIPERTAF